MQDLSFSDVVPRKRDVLVSMATVAVGITVVTGIAGIVIITNRMQTVRTKVGEMRKEFHNGELRRRILSIPLRRYTRP